VLAVGEHLLGHVDDGMLRMSTALAGGVGGSYRELCGALSGGALLIGALYGRTDPNVDDTECRRLVCCYRDRFVQELGASLCFELRESGYGSEGQWPCSTLVERAARILLKVLADEAGR
jgi:C_GCAxxG_C_C family probable redox protein